jgi:hypothetical protein
MPSKEPPEVSYEHFGRAAESERLRLGVSLMLLSLCSDVAAAGKTGAHRAAVKISPRVV